MIYCAIFFVLGTILGWMLCKQNEKGNRSFPLQEELLRENGRLQALLEHREKDAKEIQETLQKEFYYLSQKILKENTREFAESSQIKMDEILSPLKQKMEIFQANLQEVCKAGTAERLTLKYKMETMTDCSKMLAEETHRLTRVLKGDVKKQGTWGELILQKVLESSGLRENVEYTLQGTGLQLSDENGKRLLPDVIVHLPDSRQIIIDSKMSYVHYDDYVNQTQEEAKEESLRKLVLSLKEHVRGLSEKNYSFAKKLDNPDFVLLFVPIEAIFALIMEKEPTLLEEAWKKSIIIASPANILAILRTVESVWKSEHQNRNTQKIADDAASLYDKFVDLLKDLEGVGKHLQQAEESFDKAMGKLSSGRGNLVKKTEDLRKLGLKTKKQIPMQYLEEEEESSTIVS